jgi:hypothetical protein
MASIFFLSAPAASLTLPQVLSGFEFAPAVFEVLPEFGPAGAGISGVLNPSNWTVFG